ncbi:hypothetical protein [Aquisphaera insulae]|uniref:hypothetical protein n=1 Tax=Aquisphaera insulae TaxID=2712864 RepID=UPI0013EB5387|nr:hypothetical protein [Aquisphaera insulae]
MPIPSDWLCIETTVEAVEAELVDLDVPELWLRAWWSMLDRRMPGDEIWRYFAVETLIEADPPPEETTGLDQVFDYGWPLRFESVEEYEPVGDLRVGYAVVRGGHVVDSIEEPPTL